VPTPASEDALSARASWDVGCADEFAVELVVAAGGVPKAGTKVYVLVNQFVDGWESLPRTYSAIVPAS